MRKIRVFDLSIAGVVERFYLMMLVTAILGFLGQFTLAAIAGFTIGVSSVLGVSYRKAYREAITRRHPRTTEEKREAVMHEAA